MSERNGIVVIGGGPAGHSAVKALQKTVGSEHVTLVEVKEYAEVPFAVLRALTDPTGFGAQIRKPWTELTDVKRVNARATGIEGDEVILDNGDRLSFEYAIVATGSTTSGYPFIKGGGASTVAARQNELEVEAGRLKEAASVLIIGGGPIGVEFAGEITATYPDKAVTIVEGRDRLLASLPAGASEKARKVLTSRGVTVVLGTRLTAHGGTYTAPDGTPYSADLVVNAIGITTNGIPVDGEASRNERGQITVDSNLRVTGRTNVFAVGDVNDVPEIKLGAMGRMQALVAAKNVAALRANPQAALKTYSPTKPIGFVTFGRKGGLVQLPFGRLDFLIALKQKDMFVSTFLK